MTQAGETNIESGSARTRDDVSRAGLLDRDASLMSVHWRIFWIAAAIFSALSIWMMLANRSFLEADGITHYMARRFALRRPQFFTDIWSRPLCVLLGAIPAHYGGLFGTRLLSLAMTLAMGVVTLRVAMKQGFRRPTLAGLFLLTMPLLFAHSFSELTEVPFALLVVCAFWAYQCRRFGLLALLASLAPLGRPEGIGVLLLVALALVLHRRARWLLMLPWPVIAWSFFGWYTVHRTFDHRWIFWLRDNWPYSPTSVYGHGSPFRFILILPAVVGPIIFPFIWLGAWRLFTAKSSELPTLVSSPSACGEQSRTGGGLRRGPATRNDESLGGSERTSPAPSLPSPEGGGWARRLFQTFFHDHTARCRLLIAIIPLGVLVAHSLLWATGRMASSGEPRYMLIVAPFWALLGAAGLSWLADRQLIRKPGWIILLAVAAPVAANLNFPVLPLKVQDDEVLSDCLADWLGDHAELQRKYPHLCTAMPMLYFRLDADRLDPDHARYASVETAKAAPDGTLLVWHSKYSNENSDATLAVPREMLIEHGWKYVTRFERGRMYVEIFLSPRDKDGVATDVPSGAISPSTTKPD